MHTRSISRHTARERGFGALHIRRNEFQFKSSWAPGRRIFENTRALFEQGQRVYISTDELGDEVQRAAFHSLDWVVVYVCL